MKRIPCWGIALLLLCQMLLMGAAAPSSTVSAPPNQDYVVFPSAATDWESWHMHYLRAQGIIVENPEGLDVTAGDINGIYNRALASLAQAFGVQHQEQVFFDDSYPDYTYLARQLDAFEKAATQWDTFASGPNYSLEMQKKTDRDEEDLTFNDLLFQIALIHRTESYIAGFDPAWYANKGADYLAAEHDVARLGKPLQEIDINTDYDFDQVAQTQEMLLNVDRRRSLSAIYAKITQGAQSPQEEYQAVLEFLSSAIFHGPVQPLLPSCHIVEDPLVLLELGEGLCGHSARLAVDLFSAGGYPARLVQAGGHVLSEVYYQQDWHYFDADTNIARAVLLNGEIPSMVELSHQPQLVDTYTSGWWLLSSAKTDQSGPWTGYKAFSYFAKDAYVYEIPSYYVKTATPFGELDESYGWAQMEQVLDEGRQLYEDMQEYTTATAPVWTAITENKGTYRLEWQAGNSPLGAPTGYRVYVGTISRGWDWHTFYGAPQLASYRSAADYAPDMQPLMKNELPGDVEMRELPLGETHLDITPQKGQQLYVSIVALDAHGQEAQAALYPPSNEIILQG